MNTQPFGQPGLMIELCSEYLSVWCIWLHVLVMSHMHFRMNPHYSCLHSEMHTWHDKNIQSNAPYKWLSVQELSRSGFESSYSRLTLRFRACFEQGVPWHSGNCRVWIDSETCTWHDKNIQLKIYAWFKLCVTYVLCCSFIKTCSLTGF